LSELFDFKLMGRVAVGAFWKSLDQSQRDQLIDAFGHLSIATFAARFNGYSGETFEVVSAEKSVRNTILVKTRLVKSNGEPVALNYLTRQSAGVWRIIDIFLDARFSELARLRADYTSVMRREGFEVLLKTIKSRIAKYSEPKKG
ncbi:MAG: ABC transporter substrate-binding protein, partial [Opitutaceae bacterium]|nr:ABC transporter substrate-binding protein [Opitutaceae bacterium]